MQFERRRAALLAGAVSVFHVRLRNLRRPTYSVDLGARRRVATEDN